MSEGLNIQKIQEIMESCNVVPSPESIDDAIHTIDDAIHKGYFDDTGIDYFFYLNYANKNLVSDDHVDEMFKLSVLIAATLVINKDKISSSYKRIGNKIEELTEELTTIIEKQCIDPESCQLIGKGKNEERKNAIKNIMKVISGLFIEEETCSIVDYLYDLYKRGLYSDELFNVEGEDQHEVLQQQKIALYFFIKKQISLLEHREPEAFYDNILELLKQKNDTNVENFLSEFKICPNKVRLSSDQSIIEDECKPEEQKQFGPAEFLFHEEKQSFEETDIEAVIGFNQIFTFVEGFGLSGSRVGRLKFYISKMVSEYITGKSVESSFWNNFKTWYRIEQANKELFEGKDIRHILAIIVQVFDQIDQEDETIDQSKNCKKYLILRYLIENNFFDPEAFFEKHKTAIISDEDSNEREIYKLLYQFNLAPNVLIIKELEKDDIDYNVSSLFQDETQPPQSGTCPIGSSSAASSPLSSVEVVDNEERKPPLPIPDEQKPKLEETKKLDAKVGSEDKNEEIRYQKDMPVVKSVMVSQNTRVDFDINRGPDLVAFAVQFKDMEDVALEDIIIKSINLNVSDGNLSNDRQLEIKRELAEKTKQLIPIIRQRDQIVCDIDKIEKKVAVEKGLKVLEENEKRLEAKKEELAKIDDKIKRFEAGYRNDVAKRTAVVPPSRCK